MTLSQRSIGWVVVVGATVGACAQGTSSTDVTDDGSTDSTATDGGRVPTGPGGGGSGGLGVGGLGVGGMGVGGMGVGGLGVGGLGVGGMGVGGLGVGGLGVGGMGVGGMGVGGMGVGGIGQGGAGGMMPVCTDILLDQSFEGGTPNASWVEASTYYGTPLCMIGQCQAVGSQARTGSWWFWGGGHAAPLFSSQQEISTATQTLVIPTGTATLEWHMEMPNCDTGVVDYFGVVVDGTIVFQTDTNDPMCGVAGYVTRSVSLTTYADGGSHSIQFIVDQVADDLFSNSVTNVFVDDAMLTSCQ